MTDQTQGTPAPEQTLGSKHLVEETDTEGQGLRHHATLGPKATDAPAIEPEGGRSRNSLPPRAADDDTEGHEIK